MQPYVLLWLISSAVGSSKPGARESYFDTLYQDRPRRWPCFVVSALAHCILVLALPSLVEGLAPPREAELWAKQFRFERALRIRVPERLYLASGGRRAGPARRPAGSGQSVRSPARPGGAEVASAARPARGSGPRRRFELPSLLKRTAHPQSILQPELPPNLPLSASVRLPELFFWSPGRVPGPPRRVFAVPGYARPPEAPASLDAPPALALPSPEPSVPFLTPPALPQFEEPPAFAVSRGLPLRTSAPQEPPTTPRGATADTSSGDPVTVLSLATQPRPLREVLVVPPANQAGALPQGAGGSGAPKPGSPAGVRGSQGQAPPPAAASGPAVIALNRLDVAPPLPEPAGRPAAVGPELNRESPSSPAAPAPAPAPASRTPLLAESTRLEHPAEGVFDVVVHAAVADGFPESAGVLSGRPVHSVYLNVGAPKEWVLQYCIPAGEAQNVEVAGGVVRLGSSSPLVAPYPRVTFRPPIRRRPGAPYVMVHGFLDVNGRMDGLRVLGLNGAEDGPVILPVLQQWELRPATQDGRPVRVEILLAIPAE